jgi:hypothetical protein
VASREASLVAGPSGSWAIDLARDHWWRSVGMSGFARRRVSSVRGFASTVLFGNQKQWSARWGHLIQIVGRRFLCFVSLSPFGQRNEVPPRTVANSDKKYSQNRIRANVSSNNPAPTPTASGSTHLKPRVRTQTPSTGASENTSASENPLTNRRRASQPGTLLALLPVRQQTPG